MDRTGGLARLLRGVATYGVAMDVMLILIIAEAHTSLSFLGAPATIMLLWGPLAAAVAVLMARDKDPARPARATAVSWGLAAILWMAASL